MCVYILLKKNYLEERVALAPGSSPQFCLVAEALGEAELHDHSVFLRKTNHFLEA